MRRRKNTKGYTLVETLVTFTLFALLMLCVVTMFVPFTKTFYSLTNRMNHYSIADTLSQKVAGQLREATTVGFPIDSGQTILFTDREGYVNLISSIAIEGEVPATPSQPNITPYQFSEGMAYQLYCGTRQIENSDAVGYEPTAANGYDGWFGTNFYKGSHLTFSFALPDDKAYVINDTLDYILLTITLENASNGTYYTDTTAIDLANSPRLIAYEAINT